MCAYRAKSEQSFLTPMAAGTQATNDGWRWSYRTIGICNTIVFFLFLFLYEETKYSVAITGIGIPETLHDHEEFRSNAADYKSASKIPASSAEPCSEHYELDRTIPMRTWRERLAFVTYTPEPIWPYYYRPFEILLTFPAVMFTALQYGAVLAWLTITSNILALRFPLPPYNFKPAEIGYMNTGPFIGNLLGVIYGGFLGDRSLLYFSRQNRGFYEPEMRLYILLLPVLTTCGGLIMFGETVSKASDYLPFPRPPSW